MLDYLKVEFEDIKPLFELYVSSLSDVYDDFLETHILESQFYTIEYKNELVGYFAIHEKDLLTQFFVKKEFLHLSQDFFKAVLKEKKVSYAFVPTCDELLLSLAMDFHKKVQLQAYFFEPTVREVEPANYPKSMLRLANLSDVEMIKKLSGNFFSDLYQSVSDRKIYILEDEVIYGFGIMENNKIHKHCRGIGMYTVEAHRRNGIGRSIILHLKDLCETLEYRPLPGCWYHNYNSKKTLESCGFASKTRLLKVEF